MKMLSPLSTEWSWPRRSLSPNMMGDVFDDFDRIVNSFVSPTYANTVGFQPNCDINESESHFMVSFDMPGVKKEDIKIEVKDKHLFISGERHREIKEEQRGSTLRHERMYGKFERTFVLPSLIDTEKIEAQFENGVLNIALPKAESAKARTIQIQSEQSGFFDRLLGNKKELKDIKVS